VARLIEELPHDEEDGWRLISKEALKEKYKETMGA